MALKSAACLMKPGAWSLLRWPAEIGGKAKGGACAGVDAAATCTCGCDVSRHMLSSKPLLLKNGLEWWSEQCIPGIATSTNVNCLWISHVLLQNMPSSNTPARHGNAHEHTNTDALPHTCTLGHRGTETHRDTQRRTQRRTYRCLHVPARGCEGSRHGKQHHL